MPTLVLSRRLPSITNVYHWNCKYVISNKNAFCTQTSLLGIPGMDSSLTLSHGTVNWLSGLAGGTAQVLVGHPFDTVKVWLMIVWKVLVFAKVRMQTSNEYKSAIDCVKRTLTHESVQNIDRMSSKY